MSMHRLTSVLSITALSLFALAGCKDEAKPSSSAPATGTGAAAAPAATGEANAAKPAAPASIPGIAAGEVFLASCNTISKDSECGDFVGKSADEKAKAVEALKMLCKEPPSESACPSDKIVGTCRVMKDIVNHYYADGPKSYALDAAKAECEKNHGHWVE